MDTQSLQAFIAVAETESFSQAAHRLHLTQPAVSKRIAMLEDTLDCQLFDRLPRKATLTPAGEALMPKAKHIVSELLEIKTELASLSGDVSGTLRIGTSHHIGLHHLPHILRKFHSTYPQVKLAMQFLGSEAACEALANGELDIAFATLPLEQDPKLDMQAIWRDPLTFVCSHTHPLSKQKNIHLKDLTQHEAILPEPNTVTFEIIEAAFKKEKLSLQAALPSRYRETISMMSSYMETIKMMASVGLGWAVLPDHMAQDKDLIRLNLGIHPYRNLGVLQRKGKTLGSAGKAFLAILPNHGQ
ncbi:LysR family transcriptional regulator [Bermanella marisrubri]|uniref:Transcriptional regulator, LysR family protein n=1 Tax=Bermanella marisrubri TaxID=207949 RepID=Q1N6N4_9GAMM|nr:LysR family transcriptional regulator [Bermanella marisrubri]EAT13558.1 transcriptional regulator, LysR family protein [Oceanobacter sp. RED65] [Bermanella marisrubri]QIZ84352.1 LysR family transcriptional regulator [Bermanella marisrubri]